MNFDHSAAQTRMTAPQDGPWVTEVARSSASEKTPPRFIPPTINSANPQAPSTARLLRHLQSSTYIRAQACAPRSRKVSREPIRVELGAWSGAGGGRTETVGRSTLGPVGCDWPPLARAAPRTAASGGSGRVRVAPGGGGGGGGVLRERVGRDTEIAGGGSARPARALSDRTLGSF